MPKRGGGSSGSRSRSAKTGRWVTKSYAKKHPSTTVTETVKRSSGKK